MTLEIFAPGVARARIAAFVAAAEAAFGVFVMMVVGCVRVFGSRGRVAFGRSTRGGILGARLKAKPRPSGGRRGGNGCGFTCGVGPK